MCLGNRHKKRNHLHRSKRASKKENKMKKTIAILLVLVLAGVGLFAADGAPGSTDKAVINLTTKISAFAAFGLTTSVATDLDDNDFSNLAAFNLATEDEITFNTTTDMYDFVDGTIVGKLHGINNNIIDIDLAIAIVPFTTSDDENASIPLAVSPETATISAADGVLGTLRNQAITVSALKADIDLAPASENYTSTVTITVTTEA